MLNGVIAKGPSGIKSFIVALEEGYRRTPRASLPLTVFFSFNGIEAEIAVRVSMVDLGNDGCCAFGGIVVQNDAVEVVRFLYETGQNLFRGCFYPSVQSGSIVFMDAKESKSLPHTGLTETRSL